MIKGGGELSDLRTSEHTKVISPSVGVSALRYQDQVVVEFEIVNHPGHEGTLLWAASARSKKDAGSNARVTQFAVDAKDGSYTIFSPTLFACVNR